MSEIPKSGIDAKFDMKKADYFSMFKADYEKYYRRTQVTEDYLVLQYDSIGLRKYYAQHLGRYVASVSVDHEMGTHVDEWEIDGDTNKPIFTVNLTDDSGLPVVMELGFTSRGVIDPINAEKLMFPEMRARYKFLGERLAFSTLSKNSQSLTTGEEARVTSEERDDLVVVTTQTPSGFVEEIILPQSFDFSWMHIVSDVTNTVYNSAMPYLQWQEQFNASFSARATNS